MLRLAGQHTFSVEERMESHNLIVEKQRLIRIFLFLFTISTISGCWIGIWGHALLSDASFSSLSIWSLLISGLLLIAAWTWFGINLKQHFSAWSEQTDSWSRDYKNKIDKGVVKLKDHEAKQIKQFAECRHKDLVATLKELHSLMASHLKNVTTETNDAALSLINQLKLIHSAISHLLQTVSENRRESDELSEGSQSTLENNQATMHHLQSYINKRIKEIDHDHTMAGELQEQATVMSDLTKLIESVSKQTTIVATNAKIEATRAGAYGKAFGVIADEITNLSQQIGSASKKIIQSIDQMGVSIEEKFKDKLDNTAKNEETNLLNGLRDQLTHMGQSYLQLEQFNRQTLDNINESSEEIKSKVNESLMAIQFQDITQQQIEVVLKSLNRFEDHLSESDCMTLAETKGTAIDPFNIEQIRELYVMKKQRDIHSRHHKQDTSAKRSRQDQQTGDITLF